MIALLWFVLAILASPFKSKSRLEAENAALRRQLIVLRREVHGRVRLTNNDRLFFVQLYRWFPSIRQVLTIVRPETLIRWHQAGFRCYWRWKSRSTGGRPRIESELRVLIRRMSIENPLRGAPRIHGERPSYHPRCRSMRRSISSDRGPADDPIRRRISRSVSRRCASMIASTMQRRRLRRLRLADGAVASVEFFLPMRADIRSGEITRK